MLTPSDGPDGPISRGASGSPPARQRNPTEWLWRLYGHTYDGLLAFGPYLRLLDEVERRADVQFGMSVLDLGCGTGNLVARVVGAGPSRVTAVDSSPSMLATAKRKLAGRQDVEFIQADLLQYLRQSGSKPFDRIILNNVAYTVIDQAGLWSGVVDALSPQGRAIVSNPDTSGTWPLLKDHLQRDPWVHLLRPRLVGVFLVDLVINLLERRGRFDFQSADNLAASIMSAGGTVSDWGRCYANMSVVFTVTRTSPVIASAEARH